MCVRVCVYKEMVVVRTTIFLVQFYPPLPSSPLPSPSSPSLPSPFAPSPPLPSPFLSDARNINEAVQYTSGVYEELAEMHSAQPKNDMIPALDVLKEYLGILEEFPDTQHLVKVCMCV